MRLKKLTRQQPDFEVPNRAICYCCDKPPPPDPLIGQAAVANVGIAKEQLAQGWHHLAWNKERAAKHDPLIEKVVNQQIATTDVNSARATDQWKIYQDTFKPVEQRMVKDAMGFDSPERKERMAAEAGADVSRGYAAARDQNLRTMSAMGINPNSGRYASLEQQTNLGLARDTAGAMNQARRNTEMTGIALRTGAAQFGRNMPNTGIAADSLALNAGNSAIGNMGAGNNMHNANSAAAAQWFGGATNSNASAANIGLGLHQSQLQATQQQNDLLGGVGSLIGTLGMAGGMAY